MKNVYDNYKYRAKAGKKTNFEAYWITSKRFYHLPYVMQYGYNRIAEFNSEIRDIHTLFRKNFKVEKEIKSAKIFITGDDIYKLYINGDFIGEGPAQSYPFYYNYNCYDVTDVIKQGENNIGVHLYYQGLFNIYLVSGDNMCGFVAQLEIAYTDGTCDKVISDRSWECGECDAYTLNYVYGYQTQFSEDINLCKWNSKWFEEKLPENVCVVAKGCPCNYNLYPQITPPVVHSKVYPEKIVKKENGYFLDFAKELGGVAVFSLKGKAGESAIIHFGEELDKEGNVLFKMRAGCTYEDIITMCGEEKFVEYFDYKGFRYMEVICNHDDIDIDSLYVLNRHYPLPEKPAVFESSDKLLCDIWKICAHGVTVGTQDTYYDCPTREKGGFVGDALITGLSHMILTGDVRVYKKFLIDVVNSSRYCPVIMAHIPTYNINFCSDYSLLIPLFMEEYYNYTGDKEFLKEILPVTEGILEYFIQFLNEDNLLEEIKHMENVPEEMGAILIDWPESLRDGYEFNKAQKGVSTVINMFFYGFLKVSAKLYEIVGNVKRSEELTTLYKKVGEGIIKCTYDEKGGLFKDTPDSTHSAIHSNALQMFFGLKPPKGYKPLIDLIKERRLNCGVYFAYFVIKGLYNAGAEDVAYDLISGKDKHSWYNMLLEGATCCTEAWSCDNKANMSWCHPWSSSPMYFIKNEMLGIKTDMLGKKIVEIAPHIPKDVDSMSLDFPIPGGRIYASFEKNDKGIDYIVKAPKDISVKFKGNGINFKRVQEGESK